MWQPSPRLLKPDSDRSLPSQPVPDGAA
jgi:hypothetical protein